MADYTFSIPDGVAKHFSISVLDQFQRPITLTDPATFTGTDAQTAPDANGLGFTDTLTVGGTAAFSVTALGLTATVEIDSPAPVPTTLVITADP